MADQRITQKIDPKLHEKMKDIVKIKGGNRTLYEEYNLAISNHIKSFQQEEMIKDSELESFINQRITKVENHLAAMMGRTGMDVSITLMGLILFLEKYFGGKVSREQIQEKLKKDGYNYFNNAIKDESIENK